MFCVFFIILSIRDRVGFLFNRTIHHKVQLGAMYSFAIKILMVEYGMEINPSHTHTHIHTQKHTHTNTHTQTHTHTYTHTHIHTQTHTYTHTNTHTHTHKKTKTHKHTHTNTHTHRPPCLGFRDHAGNINVSTFLIVYFRRNNISKSALHCGPSLMWFKYVETNF